MADYKKPLPVPDPLTKIYWDSVKAHAMQMQQCDACHKFVFYPRNVCPHCGSRNLSWKPVSGKGKVYGFTISHQKGMPVFGAEAPYTVAVVELEEGVRMMTNLIGIEPDPDKIKVGMAVVVHYDDVTETITLPKFKPA
jgi:uncharacterized OB-fold protein